MVFSNINIFKIKGTSNKKIDLNLLEENKNEIKQNCNKENEKNQKSRKVHFSNNLSVHFIPSFDPTRFSRKKSYFEKCFIF